MENEKFAAGKDETVLVDLSVKDQEKAVEMERVLFETRSSAKEIEKLVQNVDPMGWGWEKFASIAEKALRVEKAVLAFLGIKKAPTLEKTLSGLGLLIGGVLIFSAFKDTSGTAALKAFGGTLTIWSSLIVPGAVKTKVPEKKKT